MIKTFEEFQAVMRTTNDKLIKLTDEIFSKMNTDDGISGKDIVNKLQSEFTKDELVVIVNKELITKIKNLTNMINNSKSDVPNSDVGFQ